MEKMTRRGCAKRTPSYKYSVCRSLTAIEIITRTLRTYKASLSPKSRGLLFVMNDLIDDEGYDDQDVNISSFEIEGLQDDDVIVDAIPMNGARRVKLYTAFTISLVAAGIFTVYFQNDWKLHKQFEHLSNQIKSGSSTTTSSATNLAATTSLDDGNGIVPAALMSVTYRLSDFVNSDGISPPFWNCSDGSCNTDEVWGPCYSPREEVNWLDQVALYKGEPYYEDKHYTSTVKGVKNMCRPGFLIIGQGKCGTSSLYHYIIEHPRAVPAIEKQIHYFKYYMHNGPRWYYQHFPTAVSFLSSGALITGEASPGYMPYPDVAANIQQNMPGPRIIAIGRNPIERAYSSYNYNYVLPTLKKMNKGRVKGIASGMDDEYYQQYIFSFEDMVQAELATLKECLSMNGTAITGARGKWGSKSWAAPEYNQRRRRGLPPLADVDGFCYGSNVGGKVLRKQWTGIVKKYPDKVIVDHNLHLVQSILGRGLYVLPLEWWYAVFRHDDIHFVCTEELSDMSGNPLSKVASFLGLPSYNFSSVVQKGAYNVGGHEGYDKEVSWDKLDAENKEQNATLSTIPLSDNMRADLEAFYAPYNERLFKLIGKRCNW